MPPIVARVQSVPFERVVIDSYPTRSAWDADAAGLLKTMLERWHLTAGAAFVGGEAAATVRVLTRQGSPAVLKVGFPHLEASHEAVALEAWSAEGLAPAVLRQDAWTWSMLLDEVDPGTSLSEIDPHEALDAGARLLGRLHSIAPPPGIPTLEQVVRRYVAHAREAGTNHEHATADIQTTALIERALREAERLINSPPGNVLLHGDFNPGNVLAAADGSWVAIDPKPLVGEASFDLFPLAEQIGEPRGAPDRLNAAAIAIGCDPQRAIRWAFVRSALNVSWYLADGDREAGRAATAEAALWEELSES